MSDNHDFIPIYIHLCKGYRHGIINQAWHIAITSIYSMFIFIPFIYLYKNIIDDGII